MKKVIIGAVLALAGSANAAGLSALSGSSKFVEMFPPVPVVQVQPQGVKALGGGTVKAPATLKSLGGTAKAPVPKNSGAGLGGLGKGK